MPTTMLNQHTVGIAAGLRVPVLLRVSETPLAPSALKVALHRR